MGIRALRHKRSRQRWLWTFETVTKLRFSEFARNALGVAAVGAVVLQPTIASAAPVVVGSGPGVFTVNAANARWRLNNDVSFTTTSSANGFNEGDLNVGGPNQQTDAFDGALSWLINGAQYRSGTGTLDVTVDGAGATTVNSPLVPLTGLTQLPPPGIPHQAAPVPNLNVGIQTYFSNTKAVARSILILQNPTGSPITVNVLNANNLGSDSNTRIVATTDGNATFNPGTDFWAVSWQFNAAPPPLPAPETSDPIVTMVFGEAGAAVQPTFAGPASAPADGNDNPGFAYNVTIPAGATRRLMAFVQLSESRVAATADAAVFNSTAALGGTDYLAGMSPAERSEVVNWTFAAAASVPTLGEWSMIGLGGLLGLSAYAIIRRRYSLAADHVDSSRWTGAAR